MMNFFNVINAHVFITLISHIINVVINNNILIFNQLLFIYDIVINFL